MSMLPKMRMPLLVDLHSALFLLGESAAASGSAEGMEIQHECRKVAEQFGKTKVRVQIAAADLFAQACDHVRSTNEPQAVAALEALIKKIKRGVPRKVIGTMNFGARSVAEIDDSLETMRKLAIQTAGG